MGLSSQQLGMKQQMSGLTTGNQTSNRGNSMQSSVANSSGQNFNNMMVPSASSKRGSKVGSQASGSGPGSQGASRRKNSQGKAGSFGL